MRITYSFPSPNTTQVFVGAFGFGRYLLHAVSIELENKYGECKSRALHQLKCNGELYILLPPSLIQRRCVLGPLLLEDISVACCWEGGGALPEECSSACGWEFGECTIFVDINAARHWNCKLIHPSS